MSINMIGGSSDILNFAIKDVHKQLLSALVLLISTVYLIIFFSIKFRSIFFKKIFLIRGFVSRIS